MTSEEDTKQQPSETPEEDTPDTEASAPAEPTGDTAEQPTASVDEEAAEMLQPLDVYALLQLSFAQLAAAAWQKMGLQPDPFTNTIVKDIDQARLAIDAAADLLKRFQPRLQGQEARDYQTMLTDLRLNFVKQSESPQQTE